jgi:hypothetical protein
VVAICKLVALGMVGDCVKQKMLCYSWSGRSMHPSPRTLTEQHLTITGLVLGVCRCSQGELNPFMHLVGVIPPHSLSTRAAMQSGGPSEARMGDQGSAVKVQPCHTWALEHRNAFQVMGASQSVTCASLCSVLKHELLPMAPQT